MDTVRVTPRLLASHGGVSGNETGGTAAKKVTGDFTINLPTDVSPTDFCANQEAQDGVKSGVAKAANVSAEYVETTCTVTAATRRLQAPGRRLGSGVDIGFEITIPDSEAGAMGVPTADVVHSSLQNVNSTEMAQFVAEGLSEKSLSYNITCTTPTVTAPVSTIIPDTTTSTAEPPSAAGYAHSRFAIGTRGSVVAALLSVALVWVVG